MSFGSWCLCQQIAITARLRQLDDDIQRRRILREKQEGLAQLWSYVEVGAPFYREVQG